MSDDRPGSTNGNGAAPPEGPFGRCLKCGEIMPLAITYPRVNGPGNTHHDARTANLCEGPVATALLYHVVGLIGPVTLVSKQPTLQTPEENYDQVIEMWRHAIEADIRIRDQKGAIVIGQARPRVLIVDWKPIGVVLS